MLVRKECYGEILCVFIKENRIVIQSTPHAKGEYNLWNETLHSGGSINMGWPKVS